MCLCVCLCVCGRGLCWCVDERGNRDRKKELELKAAIFITSSQSNQFCQTSQDQPEAFSSDQDSPGSGSPLEESMETDNQRQSAEADPAEPEPVKHEAQS